MNNIGLANVVILKRPVVKESHKSALTQVSRPQDFWPISRLTRPAIRSVEKPLVQQTSQNLERLSEKTARPPSFSPPPPDDDEMEDSATVGDDDYGMRGVLHPGQDRQVQFEDQDDGVYDRPLPLSLSLPENDDIKDSAIVIDRYEMGDALPPRQEKQTQLDEEDDGVYDIPESRHYQKKKPPLPRPQQADEVQDDRFQTEPFLENSVSLPIWQRLDQSPQSKVQLAQAIASSWLPKRKERPARPNPVGTAAVAAKFWTPPSIEPVAHKDKEGYDQLLLKKRMCKVDWGPGAKIIWGRSIPKILPLINGQLVRLHGLNPAEIMLEFAPKRKTIGGHTPELLREVIQGEVEELEESPEGLLIGRMMDQKRRNSELLWSDQHRKITRHMKGIHKPPDRIPRSKRITLHSLFCDF